MIFDYPTPIVLAEHLETRLVVPGVVNSAEQPDVMARFARFNDITRELQTLLNQPDWQPEDKAHLTTRIQTLLTTLGAHLDPHDQQEADDEDIHSASESELFAILDEELGS